MNQIPNRRRKRKEDYHQHGYSMNMTKRYGLLSTVCARVHLCLLGEGFADVQVEK